MPTLGKFDKSLHPRGRDGRFIEKLGFVKFFDGSSSKGRRGQVVGMEKNSSGDTEVTVEFSDGSTAVASPDSLQQAARTKATLNGRTSKKSAPSSRKTDTPSSVTGGTGTNDDPYVVDNDVETAARLLGEGKAVRLTQPEQVSTLLDKLKEIVDDARSKGEKAPVYDLCKVTVPKTNLFCVESKGIPRVKMPQLSGVPIAGSKGDSLDKDDEGAINLNDLFADRLKSMGIDVVDEDIDSSKLKASQNELNGGKVAGISNAMAEGKIGPARIFVTDGGYVVDGHHRWAAQVGLSYKTGQPQVTPTRHIKADIITILKLANDFAEEYGIPQAGVSASIAAFEASLNRDCGCGGNDALVSSLRERVHGVDPIVASLRERVHGADALTAGPLSKFTSLGRRAFDPDLHPRGKDGRFIEKFGFVKYVFGNRAKRGQVVGIRKDKSDDVIVSVRTDDGVVLNVKSNQLESIPTPKARLTSSQPVGEYKKQDELDGLVDAANTGTADDPSENWGTGPTFAMDEDQRKMIFLLEDKWRTTGLTSDEEDLLQDLRAADAAYREYVAINLPKLAVYGWDGPSYSWPEESSLRANVTEDGKWLDDRRELHESIIGDALTHKRGVEKPTMVFLAGGTASGKSTTRKAGQLDIPDDPVELDADTIKKMLPDYLERVAAGDETAAAYAHEESSMLNAEIRRRAVEQRSNIVLDAVGDTSYSSVAKKVEEARRSGYSVDAHYMTVPTDVAVQRASDRANNPDSEDFGRKVDEALVRHNHRSVTDVVIEAINNDLFDSLNVWNTDVAPGDPGILIARKLRGQPLEVIDERLFDEFVTKGSGKFMLSQEHQDFDLTAPVTASAYPDGFYDAPFAYIAQMYVEIGLGLPKEQSRFRDESWFEDAWSVLSDAVSSHTGDFIYDVPNDVW
jgi:predicted ABC-type ATPase